MWAASFAQQATVPPTTGAPRPVQTVAAAAAMVGQDLFAYLTGAGAAAVVNFPLWKAAAIGQSGMRAQAPYPAELGSHAITSPPAHTSCACVCGRM